MYILGSLCVSLTLSLTFVIDFGPDVVGVLECVSAPPYFFEYYLSAQMSITARTTENPVQESGPNARVVCSRPYVSVHLTT